METNKGNLIIAGSGTASGGDYVSVHINGSGRIGGDISCEDFVVNGSAQLKGALKAEKVKISGSAGISGDAQIGEVKVSGSANVGALICRQLHISGDVHADGDVKGEEIRVSGSLHTQKNLDAECLAVKGIFDVEGLVNAETIEATLYHSRSRAAEIGCRNITVRRGTGSRIGSALAGLFLPNALQPLLETETIEGDEIRLENTHAKVVRGTRVVLGKGCEVGLVEYKEEFEKSDDARVGESRKV